MVMANIRRGDLCVGVLQDSVSWRLSLADCKSFVVVISPWIRFALVVTRCPLCFEKCRLACSQDSRGRAARNHMCGDTFPVFTELRVNFLLAYGIRNMSLICFSLTL